MKREKRRNLRKSAPTADESCSSSKMSGGQEMPDRLNNLLIKDCAYEINV